MSVTEGPDNCSTFILLSTSNLLLIKYPMIRVWYIKIILHADDSVNLPFTEKRIHKFCKSCKNRWRLDCMWKIWMIDIIQRKPLQINQFLNYGWWQLALSWEKMNKKSANNTVVGRWEKISYKWCWYLPKCFSCLSMIQNWNITIPWSNQACLKLFRITHEYAQYRCLLLFFRPSWITRRVVQGWPVMAKIFTMPVFAIEIWSYRNKTAFHMIWNLRIK